MNSLSLHSKYNARFHRKNNSAYGAEAWLLESTSDVRRCDPAPTEATYAEDCETL